MIVSCKKDQLMNNGVIVGWNYGACAMCGGFYLNLSNDTVKNSNTFYVLNYPDSLTQIINQFSSEYNKNQAPIYVFVNWQPIPNQKNWIRVTDIRPR
jgi:hypothetical protein